jgi:hypothetical protein
MHDPLVQWIAAEVEAILVIPTAHQERDQRIRIFLVQFAEKMATIPNVNRESLLHVLWSWYDRKAIDGYVIPTDDETMDWLEELVGTMDGILSENE